VWTMASPLPTAQVGCLLLADITGYTSYLQGTELEHAQDVLADLLETIIAGIEPPFEVAKLEGDAVFAHMPAAQVDAPLLFDTIEATYFAFRRRLRDVVHSTTCDCNACVLIPSLDLKFFVHSGSYVVRKIGRSEELTGADVVLVHRLLKGSAREIVANDAYLVLTRDAVDAIDGDAEALGLVAHVEHFDVGDVNVFIENLQERWASEERQTGGVVTAETALGTFETTLPGTPRELWRWFTDPRKRLEWQEGLDNIDEFVEGRRGVGTVNHCAHGGSVTVQQVVDWHPFETFTTRDKIDDSGLVVTSTTVFAPTDSGTKVTFYFQCEPEAAWPQLKANIFGAFERAHQNLEAILSAEALSQ
jgi:class 3 adenylate cyclase